MRTEHRGEPGGRSWPPRRCPRTTAFPLRDSSQWVGLRPSSDGLRASKSRLYDDRNLASGSAGRPSHLRSPTENDWRVASADGRRHPGPV